MTLLVRLGMTRDVEERARINPGTGKRVVLAPAIRGGLPVFTDLRQAPHVLISGTTGSGKSVAIHAMLADLIADHSPKSCSLVLIDPKRVEFSQYKGMTHLAGPSGPGVVYKTPQRGLEALAWVLGQVEARFALMELGGVKDIDEVPDWALEAVDWSRYLVLVIDELADLMMSSEPSGGPGGQQKGAEPTLARILQLGRAAGVHAVLATQRPSHDVVTGLIKANVPSRLCFALQNATDSRVALGVRGAEDLTGKGDGLWLPVGSRTALRIQGHMVS